MEDLIFIDAWNVRNNFTRRYGPFEMVQMTYNILRVEDDPEALDRELAHYNPTCQENNPTDLSRSPDGWVFEDGFIASDFALGVRKELNAKDFQ